MSDLKTDTEIVRCIDVYILDFSFEKGGCRDSVSLTIKDGNRPLRFRIHKGLGGIIRKGRCRIYYGIYGTHRDEVAITHVEFPKRCRRSKRYKI